MFIYLLYLIITEQSIFRIKYLLHSIHAYIIQSDYFIKFTRITVSVGIKNIIFLKNVYIYYNILNILSFYLVFIFYQYILWLTYYNITI